MKCFILLSCYDAQQTYWKKNWLHGGNTFTGKPFTSVAESFNSGLPWKDPASTLTARPPCLLLPLGNRELKQQQRRRLRKRHIKSKFALLQTLSRLFHLVYFVKCWQMFLELNSKGLYQSSGKEKQSCCLAFPSSTKREFRHFHVVVVQRRQRECTKKASRTWK